MNFTQQPALTNFDCSSDSKKPKNKSLPTKEKSERKRRSKQTANGILKFDKVSCDELDPKVLLYNRIFKTGSSTTESIIMNSSSTMNYDYKIGEKIKSKFNQIISKFFSIVQKLTKT